MRGSRLGAPLAALLERSAETSWTGTASALQGELADDLPPDLRDADATRFSIRLRSEAAALRASGIDLEPPESGGRAGRQFLVRRISPTATTPEPSLAMKIAAARAEVDRKLVLGEPTSATRKVLADLLQLEVQLASDTADVANDAERDRQAAIQLRASGIAVESLARIDSALKTVLHQTPNPATESAAHVVADVGAAVHRVADAEALVVAVGADVSAADRTQSFRPKSPSFSETRRRRPSMTIRRRSSLAPGRGRFRTRIPTDPGARDRYSWIDVTPAPAANRYGARLVTLTRETTAFSGCPLEGGLYPPPAGKRASA